MAGTSRDCLSRRQMTGLWVATLLPAGFAMLTHLAAPQTQATATPTRQRALTFDRYMVHPYVHTARSTISAQFRFVNRGPHAVHIQRIDRSCGCLNRGLSQRTFQPGESGQIALQVETANETPGHKQYYADVHYAYLDAPDPDPQTVRLRFQVDLPERQVSVRPKALIFYQLGDQPSTREIVVSDYRKRRLRILSTSSSSPMAQVRTTGVDEQNSGERRLKLEVTVDGIVPPGKHEAVITIRTDDPDYRRLQVPLIIQGPAASTPASDTPSSDTTPPPSSVAPSSAAPSSAAGGSEQPRSNPEQ